MRKYWYAVLAICLFAAVGFKSKVLDVVLAPDGIQIGEDIGGRLPIKEWDEYPFEHGLGEMTAGEVRTLDFGELPTISAGAKCNSELYNPDQHNGDKLLILHSWYFVDGEDRHMYVMVKNLSSSTVDFENDQVIVTCSNSTGSSIKNSRRRK